MLIEADDWALPPDTIIIERDPANDGVNLRPPPINPPLPLLRWKHFRTSYDLTALPVDDPDTVVVRVGKDADISTFHLSAAALRDSSEYFANALKRQECAAQWQEQESRFFSLPAITGPVFDLFARWLAGGMGVLQEEDECVAELVKWRNWLRDLEVDEKNHVNDPVKKLCPANVWDFDLTTEAWFLGDYLRCTDFQDHCLGHLYYMNLRFVLTEDDWDVEKVDTGPDAEAFMLYGTVAYVHLDDVLHTWAETQHTTGKVLFEYDHHPLRRFYRDWLLDYWTSYEVQSWDEKTHGEIIQVMRLCPGLVHQLLVSWTDLHSRTPATYLEEIRNYWVDPDRVWVAVGEKEHVD